MHPRTSVTSLGQLLGQKCSQRGTKYVNLYQTSHKNGGPIGQIERRSTHPIKLQVVYELEKAVHEFINRPHHWVLNLIQQQVKKKKNKK